MTFQNKLDTQRKLIEHKSHSPLQGDLLKSHVHYTSTKTASIMLILAIAATEGYVLGHMDIQAKPPTSTRTATQNTQFTSNNYPFIRFLQAQRQHRHDPLQSLRHAPRLLSIFHQSLRISRLRRTQKISGRTHTLIKRAPKGLIIIIITIDDLQIAVPTYAHTYELSSFFEAQHSQRT